MMKKLWNKVISFVLVFVMIVGMLPTNVMQAYAAGDTTVWILAPGWDKVNVYTWNGPGEAFGGWPGTEATKDGTTDWYSITVPTTENFNLIFTNSNESKRVEVYINSADVFVVEGSGIDGENTQVKRRQRMQADIPAVAGVKVQVTVRMAALR